MNYFITPELTERSNKIRLVMTNSHNKIVDLRECDVNRENVHDVIELFIMNNLKENDFYSVAVKNVPQLLNGLAPVDWIIQYHKQQVDAHRADPCNDPFEDDRQREYEQELKQRKRLLNELVMQNKHAVPSSDSVHLWLDDFVVTLNADGSYSIVRK